MLKEIRAAAHDVKEHLTSIPLEDVFTLPNVITLGRLLLSPLEAKRLYDDPGGRWPKTALFMMSDNVDGLGAKAGERWPILQRFGLKKSEFGRITDPFTDTITTSEMVVAGTAAGVIPKRLAALALAQKGLKAYHGFSAYRQGANVQVTDFGRHMEGLTNLGVGMLFPGENIENEEQRRNYRQKCLAVAVAGIAGAYIADRGYKAQAQQQLGKN